MKISVKSIYSKVAPRVQDMYAHTLLNRLPRLFLAMFGFLVIFNLIIPLFCTVFRDIYAFYSIQFEIYIYYRLLYIFKIMPYHLLFILIVLSRPVEAFLRHLYDYRRVATQTEKKRVSAIYSDVYETFLSHTKINKNVKVYISDTATINASCLGSHTIILNRGAIETLDDYELKGLLAHELAHIVNFDSQINLFIAFGSNVYMLVSVIIQQLFLFLIRILGDNFVTSLLKFLALIPKFIIWILELIWGLLLGKQYRLKEYLADDLAVKLGFGNNLLDALYKMYHMQFGDDKKMIDRYLEDHPRVAYRIENIEKTLRIDYPSRFHSFNI